MATKCRATNQAGRACAAEPLPSGWCRWHDPALAEQRREWSARGGRGKSNASRAKKAMPVEAMTPAEIQGLLSVVLRGTIAGRVAPNVANAAAAVARTIVTVREASEVEERLSALEAAAGLGEKTA